MARRRRKARVPGDTLFLTPDYFRFPEHYSGPSLYLSPLIIIEFVDQCHKENKLVTVWNVNNKEDLLRFKELNVDFIGTDNPTEIN